MPYGKGTYGTKKGRPSKAAKASAKKNMTPAQKKKMMAKKKKYPELKKRKAAYKAKNIATQKSKATKAAATLKKNTGLTPKQYYSKLEERRSKMAKKRK